MIEKKREESERIKKLTAEFLKKGGKVNPCSHAATGQEKTGLVRFAAEKQPKKRSIVSPSIAAKASKDLYDGMKLNDVAAKYAVGRTKMRVAINYHRSTAH